ncbi:MAG: hypothetical protein IT361_04980 [Gemmatimonadaceae bacterium]|nr:hypothetical protein [Gemmatimonadaceae bacterium]
MAARKSKSHKISLKAAAKLTDRHRKAVKATTKGKRGAMKPGALGGAFDKKAVTKLLERADAKYLRFYYGTNARGNPELVLVAADAAGNDLTETTLDGHWPCPPFCPPDSSDLRG